MNLNAGSLDRLRWRLAPAGKPGRTAVQTGTAFSICTVFMLLFVVHLPVISWLDSEYP